MLEEENKKMKFSFDKVSKEKATILGQMIKTTDLSVTTKMKIENEMQYLKNDMRYFKDIVLP